MYVKEWTWTQLTARCGVCVSLCSVFCQEHRVHPKGEMQVNQTCCSELELHNLSPPPSLIFFPVCSPPFCTSWRPRYSAVNRDNCCVIDFFVWSTGVKAAWVPSDKAIDSWLDLLTREVRERGREIEVLPQGLWAKGAMLKGRTRLGQSSPVTVTWSYTVL